jgi:hypothetical protein
MRRPAHRWTAHAAALLALALLAFATVKSAVMQVEAQTILGQPPICSVSQDGIKDDPHHGMTTVCAFCAAAAHASIQTYAPPLRRPSVVLWCPPAPARDAAVAQPDALTPKARGPPASV